MWFELKGDHRLKTCSTEGCGGQTTWRLEADGVGSNYCSGCKERMSRSVWYVVADLHQPKAEPFAVISVDASVRREDGVEGTVISLHWQREEAERIAHEFNNGPMI